jgi:hypothetical protein
MQVLFQISNRFFLTKLELLIPREARIYYRTKGVLTHASA